MTNTPSPDEDRELIELLARLRLKVHRGQYAMGGGTIDATGKCTMWGGEKIMESYNPDGPAAAARIESLLSDRAKLEERVRECEDGLDRIADVWTLQARTLPTDRKWHCQHEEWLSAAVEQARASLNRSTDRAT